MIKLYHLRIHHSLRSTVILFSLIFFIKAVSFQLCVGGKKKVYLSHTWNRKRTIPAYHSLQVLLNGRATAALRHVMDPSLLTCEPFVAENVIDQWEENLIPCGHRRQCLHSCSSCYYIFFIEKAQGQLSLFKKNKAGRNYFWNSCFAEP